jgi:hypothetical protein
MKKLEEKADNWRDRDWRWGDIVCISYMDIRNVYGIFCSLSIFYIYDFKTIYM